MPRAMLKPPQDRQVEEPRRAQAGRHPVDGVEQCLVVAFDVSDDKAGALDDGAYLVDGARVGEAGDPAGESLQFGVEAGGVEPDVGDAHTTAGAQDPGKFGGGGFLVGKRAERALAHHRIDAGVVDR